MKTIFDTKRNKDNTNNNATLTSGTWPEAKENKMFDMKPGAVSDPFEIQKDIFDVTKVIAKNYVQKPNFRYQKTKKN